MVVLVNKVLEKLAFRRMLSRWTRWADEAPAMGLGQLRRLRDEARSLRRQVDRLLHEADHRLTLPAIGTTKVRRPAGTDWAWRPAPWRGAIPQPGAAGVSGRETLHDGVTLFHDCGLSEISYRQVRNTRESDMAPFGLSLEVFRFDGTYLSLVLDLPPEGADGLLLRHLVRVDAIVETERPIEVYVRLNIKHGPNVEKVVRKLPLDSDETMVEFDLTYTKVVEKRIEKLWLDLIFDGPEMNQIVLRDLSVSRRPRAEV